MINLQPTLIGKFLKLRPLHQSDFNSLFAAASDPLIWTLHPEPDRYTIPTFTKYFNSGIECKGALFITDSEGKAVGSSRYYHYRPTHRDVKIGYTFLTRNLWSPAPGNREMKHLMMSHIYQWVDNIFFEVGENNLRSRKAMEKIGGILLDDAAINK